MGRNIVMVLLVVALCSPMAFARRSGGRGNGSDRRSGGGTIGAIGGIGVPGQGRNRPDQGQGQGPRQRDNDPLVDLTPDGGASFVGSMTAPDQITKFVPTTREQIAASLESARKIQQSATDTLRMKFTELQTEHFIIFTDWASRQHDSLKKEMEAAYSLICKTFGASAKDNVFAGKLTVYIIAGSAGYQTFAKEMDSYDVPDWALGYCWVGKKKIGDAEVEEMHLVLGPHPTAEKGDPVPPPGLWKGALTRAVTFAFTMRYRSDQPVPFWLMQGIADVIADGVLPNPDLRRDAYLASINPRFDPFDVISGKRLNEAIHPVMQTFVETLLAKDRKGLVGLINGYKDGKNGPTALDESYRWNYDAMLTAWRQYVKRFAPTNQG